MTTVDPVCSPRECGSDRASLVRFEPSKRDSQRDLERFLVGSHVGLVYERAVLVNVDGHVTGRVDPDREVDGLHADLPRR